MPELMKDKYYNYDSLHDLALRVKDVYNSFCIENFINNIIDETWENLDLKARMRKITLNLGKYLPTDYEQALGIIDKIILSYPKGHTDWALMYLLDFVEVYGQDKCYWDLSIAAIERYTPLSTGEFAVRPFIINNEERMMKQMAIWAKSSNEHVRRLSSEGCRPALPWGQALVSFKRDPSPILRILEQLKADPSLYVRKSVANNINDISKTHPDLIVELTKNWYGKHEYTDWILKHGCRTLLKKGNQKILAIFGYHETNSLNIDDFILETTTITIGEVINFSFMISGKKATKVRLEYGIDYVKNNVKRNRKIFQISEILLKANQEKRYKKTHSFANLSSRKHYPGTHSITLIVNGVERGTLDFELLSVT